MPPFSFGNWQRDRMSRVKSGRRRH